VWGLSTDSTSIMSFIIYNDSRRSDDFFYPLCGDWILSFVSEDVPKPEDNSGLGVWAKMTIPQLYYFWIQCICGPCSLSGVIFHVPLKLSKTGRAGQPLRRTRGGFLSLIKKFLFLGSTRQQICITGDNYVENVY